MRTAVNPPSGETAAGETAAVPAAAEAQSVPAAETAAPASEETHDTADRAVKGLTTFGDLLNWGVTAEAWEAQFGESMGSRAASLKDWVAQTGRSMSEVRAAAQQLVDSAA
jgi:hypothetical protein